MQLKREQLAPTKVKLIISAEPDELSKTKQAVTKRLGASVKVPGFRAAKAPQQLVEKQLEPTLLQSEFLDELVNQLFAGAVEQGRLRPVAPPEIAITKFVPFSTLEFSAEVEVVGDIKLADYKSIKLKRPKVEVTEADVEQVLDNLRQRAATKTEVKRPAKNADEVIINFKGKDTKTEAPIDGADGQAYPLILGSKNFIPGFEDQLLGLKAGESKTFKLTFPKDYGQPALQNTQVTFTVEVVKVQELNLPKLDNAFAASVGPFKTLAELKTDIKRQLKQEKDQEADRAYENELLQKIAEKSEVAIPPALVESEVERSEEDEKRNIVYRGQTWQEHLAAEGVTEEEHRERQRAGAQLRVKAGLILGEIAQAEQVNVSPPELEQRIALLKGQYTDAAMQAELDKPDNRRDILSRMLTEKTLDLLRTNAAKP